MKRKGADTVLGNLWWVIDPLMLMVVYVILVTVITQKTTPDYPLFIFSAILPWKWFTSTMQDAVGSVTSQERLIKQLHFPKLVLPVASVFSGVESFAFGLIPLGLLMVFFYSSRISPYLLLIPVVAFVQLVFSLGMATMVSSINVFYRDMGNAIRYALRIWFYLSPALYSATQLASLGVKNPTIAFIFNLNPFTILFECYRNIIYNGTPPLWGHLAALLVFSAVLFCLATSLQAGRAGLREGDVRWLPLRASRARASTSSRTTIGPRRRRARRRSRASSRSATSGSATASA